MLDKDTVINIIKIMLGREPRNLSYWMKKETIEDVVREISSFDEFSARIRSFANGDEEKKASEEFISFRDYVRPSELSRAEVKNMKIRIIGTCLVDGWPDVLKSLHPTCEAEFILLNNLAQAPKLSAEEAEKYNFQIINIPTRFLLSDYDIIGVRYIYEDDFNRMFNDAKLKIDHFIMNSFMENENLSIETFFTNFILPHRDPFGRFPNNYTLLDLYSKINEYLSKKVLSLRNSFILDINGLANIFGKRFLLDDPVWLTSHGGFLTDFDYSRDLARLDAPPLMSQLYENRWREFVESIWDELLAMHKTLSQEDMVKLVITDLDDTLWRGVIGEQDSPSTDLEGWPLGYLEALLALKRRGVLLAIVSKNTEEVIRKNWERLTHNRISLSDFVSVKINWKTKVENIEEILSEIHLTPESVVFIDDNPVEREGVRAVFHGMRILGASPYTVKRVLLWSAETQISRLSNESALRTEMLKAASQRTDDMRSMSRAEFLASLNVNLSIYVISAIEDDGFSRSHELINKTNQFNTTGERWTLAQFGNLFKRGGRLFSFEVTDRYTNYGLVGVIIVSDARIIQFVMSCRVIGLDVEIAAVRAVLSHAHADGLSISGARFVETEKNLACRDVYARVGMVPSEGEWAVPASLNSDLPGHVKLTWQSIESTT